MEAALGSASRGVTMFWMTPPLSPALARDGFQKIKKGRPQVHARSMHDVAVGLEDYDVAELSS